MSNRLDVDALLACPDCKFDLATEGTGKICLRCGRSFSRQRGILSFLSPDERFNGGTFEPQQLEAWSRSAALRQRIRKSRVLSLANRFRIRFSMSGRRDRIFQKGFRRRRQQHETPLILDLGCGGGRHYFADYGFVVGIDPVLELLQMAREVYPAVYQSGGGQLPFRDSAFDYVVSSDVIGHIPFEKKDQMFAEIYRVLKPGGRTIHCIETDANHLWFSFGRQHPALFQRHFIDRFGHVGMELPSRLRARFLTHGFHEVLFQKFAGLIQEPGTVASWFDNEYRSKSKWISLCVACDRLFSPHFLVVALGNFILEPVARLENWLSPLDHSSGALVIYEKPAGLSNRSSRIGRKSLTGVRGALRPG
jgi:ubiquinone/menaquinone biosynthesis C-methylase UbiE